MNVNSRFLGEYALTGAFFWVAQFIVLVTIDPDNEHRIANEELIVDQVTRIINGGASHLPLAIQESAVAIVFLALIVVFFTGLVLDLLKVAFRTLEMDKFMDHVIAANEYNSWLDHKIAKHCPYDEEYKELGQYKKIWLLVYIPGLLLIHRSIRWVTQTSKKLAAIGPTADILVPHYVKLHSFLLSFVLVHSNQANLDPLTQATRLWRSSREISVAMFILLVEGFCIAFLLLLSKLMSLSKLWPGDTVSWIKPVTLDWEPVLATLFALCVLFVLSLLILRSVFSRLCYTLLSLFYVTAMKVEEDNNQTLRLLP